MPINIFVIDYDPIVSGQTLCDKHIVKMPLETAQMLCTAHWMNGSVHVPYKASFKHHPCTKWASENYSNYMWLAQHGISLCKEYTARYDRRHKCQDIIEWAKENQPPNILNKPTTAHPQCMPDDCKSDNTVEAYRKYYLKHKRHIANWKRNKPAWFK